MEKSFLNLKQIVQDRNANSRIFVQSHSSESISSKKPQDKFETTSSTECESPLHQSGESYNNQNCHSEFGFEPPKVVKMVENVSVNGALQKGRTKSDFSSPSPKRLKINQEKSASKKVGKIFKLFKCIPTSK
jgi:hypothetical protein